MPFDGPNIARLADARRRRTGGDGTSGGGAATATLLLDPKYPEPIAFKFIEAHHTDAQGRRLLLCQGGVFYRYDGTACRPIEEAQLNSAIYEFLRPAFRPTETGAEPFDADQRKVSDILHALRGLVHLSAEIAAPAWLGEAPADLGADDVLACADGTGGGERAVAGAPPRRIERRKLKRAPKTVSQRGRILRRRGFGQNSSACTRQPMTG